MSALIAHSPNHLYILYIVMVLCYAPEWIGTFIQRPEKGAQKRDRGSHFIFIACILVGIFAAFTLSFSLPAATLAWQQPLLFWCGIVLMLAGLGFRWYAIRVLGRFFTRDVATRAGQYVVESGPYRLIRHPSYTGSLLMFLGNGLALTNWASLVVIMVMVCIGLGYRVHVEEQALCDALGPAYRDYMQRTQRFIPHVW